MINSTGLKVYGADEWLADKNGQRARRGWRELHLAVDASSGQIVEVRLTDQDADDGSLVGAVARADSGRDCAIHGRSSLRRRAHLCGPCDAQLDIAVVITPRASSTPPDDLGKDASRRDVRVRTVAALGRLCWRKATGYGRRALVETTMGRYKALFGPRLRARHNARRRTDTAVGAGVLEPMLAAGRPNSVRTAPNVS